MTKLTGTDAALPAQCAAPGWMRWAHSTRDGLAHAFPVEDSQQGRWLGAVCSETVPPAALGPATVVGVRCPRCVLAVAAPGTARHRRDRTGACTRLLAWLMGWWRRDRHDSQSPPFGWAPDITLPPTTVEPADHEVWAPSVAGPGRDTTPALVPPPPVHHYPRAAR